MLTSPSSVVHPKMPCPLVASIAADGESSFCVDAAALAGGAIVVGVEQLLVRWGSGRCVASVVGVAGAAGAAGATVGAKTDDGGRDSCLTVAGITRRSVSLSTPASFHKVIGGAPVIANPLC